MRLVDFSLLVILVSLGCGETPPPEAPFILTDKGSLGFGTEFNRPGVYLNASLANNLIVMNKGLSDLKIDDVTISGDDVFFMHVEGQECSMLPPKGMACSPLSNILPVTVKGKQQTYVEVFFTPRDVRVYSGAITIKSNADNVKNLEIKLCGVGIKSIGDGGEFERPDGGCSR